MKSITVASHIFVTIGDQEKPIHLYRFTKRNTPGCLADVLSLHEMKSYYCFSETEQNREIPIWVLKHLI